MSISLTQGKSLKRKRVTLPPAPIAPKDYVMGIDMGLVSPGVATFDPVLKLIRVYWLRGHVCEPVTFSAPIKQGCFASWQLLGYCVERRTDAELKALGKVELFNRFHDAIDLVLLALDDLGGHQAPKPKIFIEGFAEGYGSQKKLMNMQKTQTLLKELGGCLRLALSDRGCEWSEIAPTSSKKSWYNSGKASKENMYTSWTTKWLMPDLFNLMHLKRKMHKQTKKLTKIPKPVHDIVDAVAIAMCFNNKKTKK